jgi:hypothetical protein
MQELIPLNIIVGDRSYRIRIEPHNEEAVRKTLKTINDQIIEFKTNFSGKDMQDYIAMVLLWYATLQQSTSDQPSENSGMLEALLKMETQLDKVL